MRLAFALPPPRPCVQRRADVLLKVLEGANCKTNRGTRPYPAASNRGGATKLTDKVVQADRGL